MSHKHANLIRAVFQEPVNCNIHWREIESLLNHLGALVEPGHGARFRIVLNGMEFFFHHPHHSNTCSRESIKEFRTFLARAGVTPSSYETGDADHPKH